MVSPPHPSWFFLGMLPLESLPWGLLLHLASCRAAKRPGNYSKEVQGKCGERAPRRGRQLCQEALRRSQMGRGALRPRAEPGLEVSTADRAREAPGGCLWPPLWLGPRDGPQGGLKNQALHIQPVSPLPEAGSSSGQRHGAWGEASPRESLTQPLHTHLQILGLGDRVTQDFGDPLFLLFLVMGLGFSPGHRTNHSDMKVSFLGPSRK